MVTNGEKIKAGQPLIEFDLDKIKEKGYDTATSVVITNYRDYSAIETDGGNAVEKEPFLKLNGGA